MPVILSLFTLICFIINSKVALCDNEQKLLIKDVINSYERPTSVLAFLSWDKADQLTFSKQLNKGKMPKSIQFVKKTDALNTLNLNFNTIVILDDFFPNIQELLKTASEKKLFASPYRWFIVCFKSNSTSKVLDILYNFNILINSEVLIAQNISNEYYELSLVYKIANEMPWIIEYFGTWNENIGLKKSKFMEISFPIRRKNLAGAPIKTTFTVEENRTLHDHSEYNLANPVDCLTKMGFLLLEPFYNFANATRANIYTDTWGYFVNGSWNGMVGCVSRGEAELTGTVLFITKARLNVINYINAPLKISILLVFREPPLSYQNNLFLLPFKSTVWWSIGGLIILMLSVLYLNSRWETVLFANNFDDDTERNNNESLNLSDIALTIVSAVSQQGNVIKLKGTIGRLLIFLLFLAFLFLYTSYSASVVVLLQSTSNQIRTLTDLLNSKLEVGTEDTPYNRHYFSKATEPVRKAILQTKKPKFMSVEEGINKLQKSQFAFNMNTGSGYKVLEKYFHEHEKCGLQEISFTPQTNPCLSYDKDSPRKEIFKLGFFRIKEHGLSNRIYKKMFSNKPACNSRGGSFSSVSLIDVYPALLMLFYGQISAFFLLAIELVVHRRFKRHTIVT